MKTAGLVFLNLGVTLVVVAAAQALLSAPAAPPAEPARPAAALPADLTERLGRLEARVDELGAAVDGLFKGMEETRRRTDEAEARAEKGRMETATAMTGILEAAKSGEAGKKGESDPFAKEISRAMRQGVRQEFRKIADLVTSPTPEGLEQRRRQVKFFAGMMGANAGLDQGQIASLERILGETDDRAMADLRPLLEGVEDYRKIDYAGVRKVTADSFAAQNEKIDQEFPKEKSDRLKQQMEPIRTMFGATIDALEKEAAGQADAPK